MKWRRVPVKTNLVERKHRSIQFKVELEKKVQKKIRFCCNTLNAKKEEIEKSNSFNIIETFTDAD